MSSVEKLLSTAFPEFSWPVFPLIVMPLLSRAKKKVAKELGSGAMHADAKQTDFCVYLSAILLIGLLLNATLGWWWADPGCCPHHGSSYSERGGRGNEGRDVLR